MNPSSPPLAATSPRPIPVAEMNLPPAHPALSRIRSWVERPGVQMVLVGVLYLALLVPTVARQGISWDEHTDLEITRVYLEEPGGWLVGSETDPTQTRLPMAVVGVLFALAATDDLLAARAVSVAAGLLTLFGVYVLGRRRLGKRAGVVAALMLAVPQLGALLPS